MDDSLCVIWATNPFEPYKSTQLVWTADPFTRTIFKPTILSKKLCFNSRKYFLNLKKLNLKFFDYFTTIILIRLQIYSKIDFYLPFIEF